MSDTESKVHGTEDQGERTYTYEDIAAVTVNNIRPASSLVGDTIHGGILATKHQNDRAYHELKLAEQDLQSLDGHVNAAMTALGHGPEGMRAIHVSLGDLLRAAFA